MLAHHIAQGALEQVGGGVIAYHMTAADLVDLGTGHGATGNRPLDDGTEVHRHTGDGALGVGDLHAPVGRHNPARITHLTATLGIKRRSVKHHLDFGAGSGFVLDVVGTHQGNNLAIGYGMLIAHKGGRCQSQLGPDFGVATLFELGDGP